MAPFRIVLCEDDDVVRQRLASVINGWDGGNLVAACATVAETRAAFARSEIDLLIADLNLPDGSGLEAIRALRKTHPRAEAMVISVLADDRSVLEAISAGATGYLLKDADSLDLIEAVESLMAGHSPISSRIARVLVRQLSEQTPDTRSPEPAVNMTSREMDILWGISKGFTYAEIAQQLHISRQTVPVHIRNIYRKLQVKNRSEAVFEATRQGLMQF